MRGAGRVFAAEAIRGRSTPGTGAPRSRRDLAAGALAVSIAVVALLALAAPGRAATEGDDAERVARAHGWGYLLDKLAHDGVDRHRAAAALADPRVGNFDGFHFSLHPREPRSMYRGFLTSSSVARARRCRAQYDPAFATAEERYGVSASVLAAILHVETACGQNTGRSPILAGLAHLAMAAEPANLRDNVERQTGVAYPLDAEEAQPIVERARQLEATFYPEVRATFEVAQRFHMDPLELRGSGSGAFGIPQFLPTSYLRYGRDGNGDGEVSLYDHDDAIASCASYLAGHGWRPDLSFSEKRRVVWEYNHSPAYIDTVLALASRIEAPYQYAEESSAGRSHHASRKSGHKSGAHPSTKTAKRPSHGGTSSAQAKKPTPGQQATRGSTAAVPTPHAGKNKLTRPAPMTNG